MFECEPNRYCPLTWNPARVVETHGEDRPFLSPIVKSNHSRKFEFRRLLRCLYLCRQASFLTPAEWFDQMHLHVLAPRSCLNIDFE